MLIDKIKEIQDKLRINLLREIERVQDSVLSHAEQRIIGAAELGKIEACICATVTPELYNEINQNRCSFPRLQQYVKDEGLISLGVETGPGLNVYFNFYWSKENESHN